MSGYNMRPKSSSDACIRIEYDQNSEKDIKYQTLTELLHLFD